MKKALVPRGTYTTSMSYDFKAHKGERNKLPSKVVPDQAMTVKEMISRHVRGLPVSGVKVPEYEDIFDEDDYLPDPRTLDIAEREDLVNEFKQKIAQIKSKQNAQKTKVVSGKPSPEDGDSVSPTV
jgi:hypothetical protein